MPKPRWQKRAAKLSKIGHDMICIWSRRPWRNGRTKWVREWCGGKRINERLARFRELEPSIEFRLSKLCPR